MPKPTGAKDPQSLAMLFEEQWSEKSGKHFIVLHKVHCDLPKQNWSYSLCGLSHRPVAHTCGAVFEIPYTVHT